MTVPTRVAGILAKMANACAARNRHPWQDYYGSFRVSHHAHTVAVVMTCVNHARGR